MIELLSFQDKDKLKSKISKLPIAQKEKLLTSLISLSSSSDTATRKRTGSTGIDIEEEDSDENEEDEIDNIGAIDGGNTQCYSKINHKIFLIQKDNSKHKYSEPLPYAYKNISNNNKERDRDHKTSLNSMNPNQRNDNYRHCYTREQYSTPRSTTEGDIYNEMKRFFMSKRENTNGMMNNSQMPERVWGNNRPHSTTNVLDYNWLNNKNFFPSNKSKNRLDINHIDEYEQKQNINPFTLNFDCFYSQSLKENSNPRIIYEDDNEMMMDAEYNPLGNKL